MIGYRDLQLVAATLLLPADVNEATVRVAVSTAYYGLFHRLATAGARLFAAGGDALQHQVPRAYAHTAMRKVCDAYVRSPAQPFPPVLAALNASAVESGLIEVANAFSKLQEARHSADYDLSASLSHSFGLEMLQLAEFAHWKMDEVEHLPQTTVFLTALLLADRWTRRG